MHPHPLFMLAPPDEHMCVCVRVCVHVVLFFPSFSHGYMGYMDNTKYKCLSSYYLVGKKENIYSKLLTNKKYSVIYNEEAAMVNFLDSICIFDTNLLCCYSTFE